MERGFSINKEVSVQNMSAQTLVAQRAIKDYLISVGGVTNVPMSKELLLSASSARQRYHRHLDEEKEHQDSEKCSKVNCQIRTGWLYWNRGVQSGRRLEVGV